MAVGEKTVTVNKQASFRYLFLEKFEAGIMLTGSEVKSLRGGKAILGDAYATMKGGALFLLNCHIAAYPPAAALNHEPTRSRKLLLHKKEIEYLLGKLQREGLTLIPTRLYFKNGRAKVELALAKGKNVRDKRETIKKRDQQKEIARAMKQRRR